MFAIHSTIYSICNHLQQMQKEVWYSKKKEKVKKKKSVQLLLLEGFLRKDCMYTEANYRMEYRSKK